MIDQISTARGARGRLDAEKAARAASEEASLRERIERIPNALWFGFWFGWYVHPPGKPALVAALRDAVMTARVRFRDRTAEIRIRRRR